jgi:hypothetical protein
MNSLRAVVEEIKPKPETAAAGQTDENEAYLAEKLLMIKAVCEVYDENAADEILAGLRKITWPQRISELLSTINEQLLHSDFDEIVDTIDKFMETR